MCQNASDVIGSNARDLEFCNRLFNTTFYVFQNGGARRMSFLTRNVQMSGVAQQTHWKLVKYSLNSFIHLFFQICLSGIMQDEGRLHSYQLEERGAP